MQHVHRYITYNAHSRVVFWRIRGGTPAAPPAEPMPPPGGPPPLGSRDVSWRIRDGGSAGGAAVGAAAVGLGDSWQRRTENLHDFLCWGIRSRTWTLTR